MTRLILQPCSSRTPIEHFGNTVHRPVSISDYLHLLTSDEVDELSRAAPSGVVEFWGVVPGVNSSAYTRMEVGDIAVFTGRNIAFYTGTVTAKIQNPAVAEQLWQREPDGRTWELMYALGDTRFIDVPVSALNGAIGYKSNYVVRGFSVLPESKSEGAIKLVREAPTAAPPPWVVAAHAMGGRESGAPQSMLLTWNPDVWVPEESDFLDMLEGSIDPAFVNVKWSTGTRNRVPPGTRAFVVRQNRDRGIVASGIVSSEVYQDSHWNGSGELTNYVDVLWEVGLPVSSRLTIEELKSALPLVPWDHLQGSGVMTRPEYFADQVPHNASRLLDLWRSHVESVGVDFPHLEFLAELRQPHGGLPHNPGRQITVEFVRAAIDRARLVGRDAFLDEVGANSALRYVLVDGDFEIDAKAIVLAAYNAEHPESLLRSSDFEGTRQTVAEPLRRLGFFIDDLRAADAPVGRQDAPMGTDPSRYIQAAAALEGSLNVASTTDQRREQSLLRGGLGLYQVKLMPCGICGREYPVALLVAGHIKRRSACTDAERVDLLSVAMPFCVFGCDALFERGLITVEEGIVKVRTTGIESVDQYLNKLEGTKAPGWTVERQKYFAWHSAHHQARLLDRRN